MSTELVQDAQWQSEEEDEWIPPMPPTDLIFDDGEPLESNRHRIAMNVLIEALNQAYQRREDYFAGGNMFVYYSSEQVRNRDFKGPDFFVVLNVAGERERQGWVVWEEQGRYPDVIVELMSPSTAEKDLGQKRTLYEQTFRTQDYFVYDPFESESLQGWHLGANLRYEAIAPDEQGWLWCETLGLWLGLWEGTILRETATWLRFYDRSGNLVLLGTERAEQEKQRADRAESVLAQAQADLERERQQKEDAIAALEEERRQKEQLRERLASMGIDLSYEL